MKKLFFICLLVFVASIMSNVFAQGRFQEGIFYPNVIIVGFDANAINTRTGDISIDTNSRGMIRIGLPSFDALANQYGFTDIKRMFWVKDQGWHDENGVYPMNIFRIRLQDNDMIDSARHALSRDNSVIFAEFEAVMTKTAYTDVSQYIRPTAFSARTGRAFTPNDPDFTLQWHLPKIQAPDAWATTVGDTTIVIAIVDDGMKWNHEDLRGNVFINWAEAPGTTINWDTGVVSGGDGLDNDGNGKVDDVIGWNFYPPQSNQSYQSFSYMIHGTHVGGIAGAVGNNAIGISGVAMNVRLLVSRHGPDHYETAQVTDPYEGILYAADTGAHIINCSWGGVAFGEEAMNYVNAVVNYATGKGAIVVTSAGNNNSGSSNFVPAIATNAIAVASSDIYDKKSDFSNYGKHITVTAPGSEIHSTVFFDSLQDAFDDYFAFSGTSMASPVVSGVIALMLSANPNLTFEQIKEILYHTADQMEENEMGGEYEGLLGGGRINALKALNPDKITNLHLNEVIDVSEHDGDGDGVINIGETFSMGISVFCSANWADARGTTATITTEMPGIEIINGVFEFAPVIAAGSTASSINRAIIHIDKSVTVLEIPFTITINSNQEATSPYPFTKKSFITVNASMSKANWPLITGSMSTASPMIANLDGTGNRLITIVNGVVHVVDVQKNYNGGFPLNLADVIHGEFAVGDVARNGYKQIVVGTNSGRVIVISHTGEILYEFSTGNSIRTTPIIADLNNDGYYEIVVGTINGTLYVFNGNDLSIWENFPASVDANILTNMAVGDINGDGTQNIVINILGTAAKVHVINPLTGQNITGFPFAEFGTTVAGSTLANISGGSGLDIIFASNAATNCPLSILRADGTVLRQAFLPSAIRTEIAVIDLQKDGVPYLIFGDNAGNIWIKDAMLEDLSGFPKNIGERIASSPVFADIDRDGNREIIFGDDLGYLHILKFDGRYLTGYPLKISDTAIIRSPWVGNFDYGTGDILLTVHNGIEFVDTKSKAFSAGWNTFRGNMGKTANFLDRRTPENDPSIPRFVNSLEQNYPNPFNPETTIRFSIKNDENVRLLVYNIRGQLVKTLLNEIVHAGEYNIVWNGTDETGKQVASGLYFYLIDTNSFRTTKRMILLK